MERITQAIILAAGEGQRLRPFTRLIPKVMLPVAGKPILAYVVEALARNGVRRLVIVVGYRKEHVQDYFGSGKNLGVEITYVTQPKQLGTAHALMQARELADERFLVVAGDNVIDPDAIAPLVTAAGSTMLIRAQDDVSKYGAVTVQDGLVREVIEKPAEKASGLVSTGIYALGREVFSFMDYEVQLTSIIQKMIAGGHRIFGQETEGTWLDAVYPWDLLKLNAAILGRVSPSLGGTVEENVTIKGAVSIGEGTVIRSNTYIVGPVVIGDNCEIGPSVCIFPSSTIGNHVVIAPFTIVRNSSIGEKCTLGPGSSILDSVIAVGTNIGSHFAARSGQATVSIDGQHHEVKMGAVIGSYCQIDDGVTVEPGVMVGNSCRVKALKVIGENVPDGGMVV